MVSNTLKYHNEPGRMGGDFPDSLIRFCGVRLFNPSSNACDLKSSDIQVTR
jgi:hypothetical protein